MPSRRGSSTLIITACASTSRRRSFRAPGLGALEEGSEGRIRGERVGPPVGYQSAPFEAGEHRQVAVKVIDNHGNDLMVAERLG